MKKSENWQNVLPITILVVVIGLGLALYWFSPANQTQLMRDVPFAVTPEWAQIDGINQRFIGCGRYAECDSNWVQVYDNNAYFLPIDPQIEFDGYYPGAGIIVETPGSPMSSTLMTVTPHLSPTPTDYPICTAVPCASEQYYCPDNTGCLGGCGMVCVEYTSTNTAEPTVTPAPTLNTCIKVVWDKGTATQGLNIRYGPSMGNNADGRSYLGPGFVFRPLEILTIPGVGMAAKVTEPNGYIFMDLFYNNDVYAIFVECPQ